MLFKTWLIQKKLIEKNYQNNIGKLFCNDFIRQSWPELYYCQDDEKSLALIVDYLVDCQYYPNVPEKFEVK